MIKVTIPDGKSGMWSVETFVITKQESDMYNIHSLFSGGLRVQRQVKPGKYKRLHHKNRGVIMSNTPAEIRDCAHFIHYATKNGGDILISGLGLGIVVQEILKSDKVTSVTVIELEEDVIKLVSPHIKDERLTIINGDAYTYKAPKDARYSAVWHDIWDSINSGNVFQMGRLHRKYARKTNWQDSWARNQCKYLKRQKCNY